MLNYDQMTMLHEMGYQGCFGKDIREGDSIAIDRYTRKNGEYDNYIFFIKVTDLEFVSVPERDEDGRIIGSFKQLHFIGIHEDTGMREPMVYHDRYEFFKKES